MKKGIARIGDIVVVIKGDDDYKFFRVGFIGVIGRIESPGSFLVDFSKFNNEFQEGDGCWYIGPSEIELVDYIADTERKGHG